MATPGFLEASIHRARIAVVTVNRRMLTSVVFTETVVIGADVTVVAVGAIANQLFAIPANVRGILVVPNEKDMLFYNNV